MTETVEAIVARPPARNGSVIDRATTYVSLGLTITLVILAFHFGSRITELDLKLKGLDKVPPREEVRLIVNDAVAPIQKELWELRTEVQLLKAATAKPPRATE